MRNAMSENRTNPRTAIIGTQEEFRMVLKTLDKPISHKLCLLSHRSGEGLYLLFGALEFHSLEPFIYAFLFLVLVISVIIREEGGI